MAKMFYTMDETKAALAKNEEEIKQLAREGRLREFRDGPRLMFKADQVEQLKSELGSGDAISLAPSDSGAPLSLAGDSAAGSGLGLSPADSRKGDTQFDIGLGGSAAGIPSPGKVAPGSGLTGLSGSGLGGSGLSGSGLSSGQRSGGITIFDVDEKVDPSAQTAINPGIKDQINLESVGSGSGLLDLTRESDDTSLGAVFDEIGPGGRKGGAASGLEETQAADMSVPAVDRSARSTLAAPIYVEAADPAAVGLGVASLVAAAVVCFGGFILAATLLDYRPDILNSLQWEGERGNGKMFLLGAAGAVGILGVVGFIVGKAGNK